MEYNFRGSYDATKSYAVKDVVSFQSTLPTTYVRYYMCLIPNDSTNPVSPNPYSDNSSWGVINALSNFPNTVDDFLYRTTVQGNDKVDIARINELTLKTSLTTAEQDELNNLIAKHRNKLFQAEDLNAIQDSLSNLQIFFKDKVDSKLNSNVATIQTEKDNALNLIETKKNNIITYLDGTTAGALRNDIGDMSLLTTTDKTSLVTALNEVRRNGQLQEIASGSNVQTLKDGLYFGANLVNAPNSSTFKIEVSTASSNTYKTYEATQLNSNQKWIQIASLHPTLGTLIHYGWVEILTNKASTWSMIPLQNGVTSFAVGSEPIFTRIGNVVHIKGAVTNITAASTIIGTLPATSSSQPNVRPSIMVHNYVQATTNVNNSARIARWVIGLDGTIKLETTSDGVYNSTHWYPIHTSFICN